MHVLTLGVVRAGIDALQGQRIHEHFPAYLHLRQQAAKSEATTELEPTWSAVGELLKMPGGPPNKPYYRPFSSRRPKDTNRYWFNKNLAGSYAAKSLRNTGSFMLDSSGTKFALPKNHAIQAREVLLKNTKVPAWALAAYYLRNYGFSFQGEGGKEELIKAFRREFDFKETGELFKIEEDEFSILFDDDAPPSFTGKWFEPFTPSNAEVEESINNWTSLARNVRQLTADDLAIGYTARATSTHGSSAPDTPLLQTDDPRLVTITKLLERFGGVILSGPPGTSKSWLAGQLADHITGGDDTRRADIQFHASYQFEDFMEGYRPKKDGKGFESRDGVFLRLIKDAQGDSKNAYVIVIDELSRADVGRVFGEALTYIERSKREQKFQLPSGESCSIPKNLYLIATMNPLDRGVDEVDAAFERRFAKVDMQPSRELLEEILEDNGFPIDIRRRLLAWFSKINSRANQTPAAAVGHAYFSDVVDEETLSEIWDYQLRYHVDRAFKYDPDARQEIVNGWSLIFEEQAEGHATASPMGDTESPAT